MWTLSYVLFNFFFLSFFLVGGWVGGAQLKIDVWVCGSSSVKSKWAANIKRLARASFTRLFGHFLVGWWSRHLLTRDGYWLSGSVPLNNYLRWERMSITEQKGWNRLTSRFANAYLPRHKFVAALVLFTVIHVFVIQWVGISKIVIRACTLWLTLSLSRCVEIIV